jgi:hypothetical protein
VFVGVLRSFDELRTQDEEIVSHLIQIVSHLILSLSKDELRGIA